MPYRIDLRAGAAEAVDHVVDLGALDVEVDDEGTVSAVMPDDVTPERVARAVGVEDATVSPATGRDEGSVWLLRPRAVRIGQLRIAPAGEPRADDTICLVDDAAFGTGLHPTTALCLERLQDETRVALPAAVLDVGTGSGVLALAALALGVRHATGLDIDDDALRTAAVNARLNGLADRLTLAHGGPNAVTDTWPFVLANVLAAPLIEMAPALVRRVEHRGTLVLSGIPSAVEPDVRRAYRHLGMQPQQTSSRGGWVALTLQASW